MQCCIFSTLLIRTHGLVLFAQSRFIGPECALPRWLSNDRRIADIADPHSRNDRIRAASEVAAVPSSSKE